MALSERNYQPVFEQATRIGSFVGGSTVTQATNRTTGVTINTISGAITTSSASLAAETAATFTVTNNQMFTDDVVLLTMAGGSNGGNTTLQVIVVAAGSFQISVANQNAAGGTAETGAIVINYLIMKASQTS